MCEIFPDVNNCCYFLTLRIGMLFIAVLAIFSGAMTWAVTEQSTPNASLQKLMSLTNAVSGPDAAFQQLSNFITGAICLMCAVFIFGGLVLLIANLTDQEGFIQIFVWLTFLNVVLGFMLVLGISIDCLLSEICILSSMDWLSGSAFLVALVLYLCSWIYFISVANSYVLGIAP